jgi:hypothetical protein
VIVFRDVELDYAGHKDSPAFLAGPCLPIRNFGFCLF